MRSPQMMQKITRLTTTEELESLPDDGYRYELVKGRPVRISLVNWRHVEVIGQIFE